MQVPLIAHSILNKNGILFKHIECKEKRQLYKGKKCKVYIYEDRYEIITKKYGKNYTWSSDNLSIYTLIGYLTYYNLIPKNYKQ